MAEIFTNGVLWIGRDDLSCYFRSVEINQDVDMHDSTTFCTDGNRTYKAGLVERGISAEGFWDGDEQLNSGKTFDEVLATAFDEFPDPLYKTLTFAHGKEIGSPAVLLGGFQANYNLTTSVGELAIANLEVKATDALFGGEPNAYGAFVNGRVLFNQTVTGTVNGATFDAGSPLFDGNGYGFIAHIHVARNGHVDDMTVKIQESPNGSSWADLVEWQFGDNVQTINEGSSIARYRRVIVDSFTPYEGEEADASATVLVAIAKRL